MTNESNGEKPKIRPKDQTARVEVGNFKFEGDAPIIPLYGLTRKQLEEENAQAVQIHTVKTGFAAELQFFSNAPRSINATHPLQLSFETFLRTLPVQEVEIDEIAKIPVNFSPSKYPNGFKAWLQLVDASNGVGPAKPVDVGRDMLNWFCEEFLDGGLRPQLQDSLQERLNCAEHALSPQQRKMFNKLRDLSPHTLTEFAGKRTEEAAKKMARRIEDKLMELDHLDLILEVNGSSLLLQDGRI